MILCKIMIINNGDKCIIYIKQILLFITCIKTKIFTGGKYLVNEYLMKKNLNTRIKKVSHI